MPNLISFLKITQCVSCFLCLISQGGEPIDNSYSSAASFLQSGSIHLLNAQRSPWRLASNLFVGAIICDCGGIFFIVAATEHLLYLTDDEESSHPFSSPSKWQSAVWNLITQQLEARLSNEQ